MTRCSYETRTVDGTVLRCTKQAKKYGRCKKHNQHSRVPKCVRCAGATLNGPVCAWCLEREPLYDDMEHHI